MDDRQLLKEAGIIEQKQQNQNKLEQQIEEAPSASWPEPLRKEAFHSLAGDIVRTLEPHTEADPAALLFSFLVMLGNSIGRTPYFVAEADRHYLNLFTCLVGTTAKGRKGVSFGQSKQLFQSADREWTEKNITQGLSSPEGLIWAVRDDVWKTIWDKKAGEKKEILEVEGIEDKRLLVVEQEFARTIRVFNREGNPLSAVMREAWDSGNLNTMTKNSPAKATGAHISIIGHITKDELLRYLDSTEAGNGFGNRFLWICVKRSKCLPEGGQLHKVDFAPIIKLLNEAVDYGRRTGEMNRNDEARQRWGDIYPALSEGKPGLLGAMIARAEAQVMRIACLYALLDCSSIIEIEHLEAALACWNYCEASARFVFGESLGDPIADEAYKALKGNSEGMTRTGLYNYFGRNRKSDQIGRALNVLQEHGLAYCKKFEAADGGRRPVERWFIYS